MARLEKLNNEIERAAVGINNDRTMMPGLVNSQTPQ